MPELLIEQHDQVTLFKLNRPEVHNNLDRELGGPADRGINRLADDDNAKVLVMTGGGDAAFCAGANLKGMNELWEHGWCLAGGVEVEICHPPVRHPDVVAGMDSFVKGRKPEPLRPRDTVRL